jgi:hypothetical protein
LTGIPTQVINTSCAVSAALSGLPAATVVVADAVRAGVPEVVV